MNFSPKKISRLENKRPPLIYTKKASSEGCGPHSPAPYFATTGVIKVSHTIGDRTQKAVMRGFSKAEHARLYVAFGKALWCKHRRRFCSHYRKESYEIVVKNLCNGQEKDSRNLSTTQYVLFYQHGIPSPFLS
jgi:hypothetical protein